MQRPMTASAGGWQCRPACYDGPGSWTRGGRACAIAEAGGRGPGLPRLCYRAPEVAGACQWATRGLSFASAQPLCFAVAAAASRVPRLWPGQPSFLRSNNHFPSTENGGGLRQTERWRRASIVSRVSADGGRCRARRRSVCMYRSQSKRPLIPSVRRVVMVIGRSVSWMVVGWPWARVGVMMMETRIQRVGRQDRAALAAVCCCALWFSDSCQRPAECLPSPTLLPGSP